MFLFNDVLGVVSYQICVWERGSVAIYLDVGLVAGARRSHHLPAETDRCHSREGLRRHCFRREERRYCWSCPRG